MRRLLLAVSIAGCVLLLASITLVRAAPTQPQATRYIVAGTADEMGSCTPHVGYYICPSLRSAIKAAENNPGSTIQLAHGATYLLTIPGDSDNDIVNGDLNILNDTYFDFGNTLCTFNCAATIRGGIGWADRLLHIQAGARVTLFNVNFAYGNVRGNGGAILIDPICSLTLVGGQVYSNQSSGYGGGIANDGTLALEGVVLDSNQAKLGGGLFNNGLAVMTNTVITHNGANEAGSYGGGLYNNSTLSGLGITVADNTASQYGGGLAVSASGRTTLTGGVVRHNMASLQGSGLHNVGQLTLNAVSLENNYGVIYSNGGVQVWGGAAYNLGALTLNGGQVYSNTGHFGGGLYQGAAGLLTLNTVTVYSNTALHYGAPGLGGGLYTAGAVNVTNSLFRANTAVGSNGGVGAGGGIYQQAGTITLTNSTLSGNSAGDATGVGGFDSGGGTAQLKNVTLAQNTGVGVYADGNVHLANTLIAGNTGGDCSTGGSALTSHGYNLIQNMTNCAFSGDVTGNITGTNPLLGPLQANGGATWTHALLGGSPAINKANPAAADGLGYHCAATDQRGLTRVGRCDIGAVEYGVTYKYLYLPLVRR